MPDGYVYDLFVSYTRKGPVGEWVHNHFYPRLSDWLGEYWDGEREPRIFIDSQIETGTRWPDVLKENLLRSRCLVAVFSPPYFRRPWCLAEWRSMWQREELLARRGPRPRLIFPVVFADGDSFPDDAKTAQLRDLSRFNVPHAQFRKTNAYTLFVRAMQAVAQDLRGMIKAAPDWESDWPVVEPPAPPEPGFQLPRL
jgi:hypothetical protein